MPTLEQHIHALQQCHRCAQMHAPPVTGKANYSKVMLLGQAPGDKEPKLQKPFAWTAGKTLFQWFANSCHLQEQKFRDTIYMAAVCRCFPGKKPKGGDRVPSREEISNCRTWLNQEISILQPELLIPVGKLAISQFMPVSRLDEVIGQQFRIQWQQQEMDMIPLPHPSGASPWPRIEPGKTLLAKALQHIHQHPAIQNILDPEFLS